MTPDRTAVLDHLRALLQKGAPWEAADVFRSASATLGDDPALLYWGALAHARSGAMRIARSLIERVRASPDVSPEIRRECLCLSGRLWKDRIDRSPRGEPAGDDAARLAHDDYRAAYDIDRHPYPGINVATLSCVLGHPQSTVHALASDLVALLDEKPGPPTPWDEATRGEALLLTGDVDGAQRCYARAVALAPDDVGSIASMRRQLTLLQPVLPAAGAVCDALPAATVLTFAGHMIDAPDRASPRFPASLEASVAAALRERLSAWQKPIVYTSAACGADLLFIEAALDVDAEVTVVLPFDRDDFVASSVAPGGADWVARFDRALARSTRVVTATDERYLGDDVLFEHAQHLVDGLAMLRAAQLQTRPSMLCVLDAAAPAGVGGTRAAAEHWSRTVDPAEVIDLATLRGAAPIAASRPQSASPADATVARPTPVPDRPARALKVALFADVAGFGRLHDAEAPLFHGRFLGLVAAEIAASTRPPRATNTWGDAVYAVFDRAEDGAAFAVGLIDRMQAIDWTEAGLPSTSHIRVALNAGPMFAGFDPIIERTNYYGASVTKAARIEPVTPPGVVYASEAFVATLVSQGAPNWHCEYVGELPLAKGYRVSRIYRIERR